MYWVTLSVCLLLLPPDCCVVTVFILLKTRISWWTLALSGSHFIMSPVPIETHLHQHADPHLSHQEVISPLACFSHHSHTECSPLSPKTNSRKTVVSFRFAILSRDHSDGSCALISVDRWSTHSRICDTAGKRNSTLFSAAMSSVTAEINISVPIIWFLSSAAVVLLKDHNTLSNTYLTLCNFDCGPLLQKAKLNNAR